MRVCETKRRVGSLNHRQGEKASFAMGGLHAVVGEANNQILWWQESVRAVVILFYGLFLIRFFGRRAFGKQSALDIVLSIVIGSDLSRALTGNAPFVPTIVATGVLVVLYWLVEHMAARSRFIGRLVKGRPIELMRDGRLNEIAMLLTGTGSGDIEESARQSGAASLSQVRAAVLERSGKISTLSENPPA